MRSEISAGAVVFRETDQGRRYLLLHYKGGHWGLVKGHVEEGETLVETVRREANEETGLIHLRFVDGFQRRIEYVFKRGSEPVHKEVTFLLAETEQSDVSVSSPDEHQDVAWVTYQEAVDRISFEQPRDVLQDAEAFLNGRQATLDSQA